MTSVLLNVADSIATITLNRPEALNALDGEMATAWAAACQEAVNEPSVKAIIVRAEGRAFSAGGDVKAMYEVQERGTFITDLAHDINTGLSALLESSTPVVAAAHGTTAGGGLGLLLSTDYAIVGESSKIGSLYANVGLTPDLSVSALLGRAVGERRALQLTLTSRMLSAQEALDWGLVAEVVPDDDVLTRAQALAQEWVAAAHAYGQAKRLIRSAPYRSLGEQLSEEARTIGQASMTPVANERMGAFASR